MSGRAALVVAIPRQWVVLPQIQIGAWQVLDMPPDEIKRAITQGIKKDGSRLKPPMGYGYYAKMNAEDLDAVVAWLRSIPAKE